VTEEFRAGNGQGQTLWRVTAREAPHLWRIENSPAGDASVVITYRLRTDRGGTVFERDMWYQFNRLWLRVLNPLFIRQRMERESKQAFANAKQILEK
jgi:hypothetical protein